MMRNNDPRIVVLDRAQFDRLLERAAVGDRELRGNVTDDVSKHARRFNPFLQVEFAAEEKAERNLWLGRRALTKAILKQKTAYYRVGSHEFVEVPVIGPGKSKIAVRVILPDRGNGHLKGPYEMPVWNLLAALP